MKGFLSDNSSSVHQRVLNRLQKVNVDHNYPYGDDPETKDLEKLITALLGEKACVRVVLNGTGANVIGMSAALSAYNSVLCVDSAHINEDECGAFERFTGSKLVTVPHENGKLNTKLLEEHIEAMGNIHHNQPKIISISQVTEFGSVYTIKELKDISKFAHNNGMLVHMDGARISNACVSLDVSLKEMITDTGIDIVSFGGTKNGLMYGELIITFDKNLHNRLAFIRKQGMQLASKMRYVSTQFLEYLKDDLWRECAANANDMGQLLYNELKVIEEVKFLASPDANIIFVQIPGVWIEELNEKHYFYTINSNKGIIRLVTSFDTKLEEVNSFIHDLKAIRARNETLMD